MRSGISYLAAAFGSSLTIAACGGSATKTGTEQSLTMPTAPTTTAASRATTTTATGISQHQAAQQYLTDVAPSNSALKRFKAQTTNAQISFQETYSYARPLIAALTALTPKLAELAQEYEPANADLKTLISTDAAEIGDLTALQDDSDADASSVLQTLSSDGSKQTAAVSVVRVDLGLQQAGK